MSVAASLDRLIDWFIPAGLAGERAVSAGMQRRVAEMIKTFMRKSKERLEK